SARRQDSAAHSGRAGEARKEPDAHRRRATAARRAGRPQHGASLPDVWHATAPREQNQQRGSPGLLPNRTNPPLRGAHVGSYPRSSHHSVGRAPAPPLYGASVEWGLARSMGRELANYRNNQFLAARQLYGLGREPSPARTTDADRSRRDQLRGHN